VATVRVRIVAVGKVKERAARELIDDYLTRLGRYCPCEQIEIKAAPEGKLTAAIGRATAGASVVALDVTGESLSSKRFAQAFERLASRGKGIVAFVIGGADGLPKRVIGSADARWSLSALTFPHRLARLVLAEQLYRAMTILRGEPYNR
jgi:23S rRNA (pseudouridine1915-N3)-methyltransferase